MQIRIDKAAQCRSSVGSGDAGGNMVLYASQKNLNSHALPSFGFGYADASQVGSELVNRRKVTELNASQCTLSLTIAHDYSHLDGFRFDIGFFKNLTESFVTNVPGQSYAKLTPFGEDLQLSSFKLFHRQLNHTI
jgi:hypothetical protein